MTLDYAGTTILQQTPWQSMWTMFGLMTTLGLSDIEQNSSTIGFYPDSAYGWQFHKDASVAGVGACWSAAQGGQWLQQGSVAEGLTGAGNVGPSMRQLLTTTDPTAKSGGGGEELSTLMEATTMDALYRSLVKSYVSTPSSGGAVGIVYQIQAQIFLRHLHSFFSQVPLLKGVFFRLTLNINQPEA